MNVTAAVIALAGALVLGCFVPWLGMRMLVPSLRESCPVENYRGRRIFAGLGIVWLLWAGCAIVGGVAISWIGNGLPDSVVPVLTLAGPLALVAFGLGVVDDAYGSGSSRGFRGHLTALRGGRLTTGGLKLFGISLASLVVALVMSRVAPWGGDPGVGIAGAALPALLAGAAIALTSNFVNLADLRPGRALKIYSLLAVIGVFCAAFLLPIYGGSLPAGGRGAADVGPFGMAIDAAVLLVFVLGPVFAVYRYDLGEQGMLGDAGANPMGAIAGLLIVVWLPRWGLLGYLALMLALNLASERYSYSSVIDGNRVLSWLDGLGRLSAPGETDRPE